MSLESPDTEDTTIGNLLQQTRIKLGLDLEDISDKTKITIASLKAIENDDFKSLPPEAFARGFYTLYAKTLSLDPIDVLHSYSQQKSLHPGSKEQLIPPHKLGLQVKKLARRPTTMPISYTGLIILFLLLIGAFLSWYFSWNPASYLSEKLRNFKKPPESGKMIDNTIQSTDDAPLFEITEIKSNPRVSEKSDPEQQAAEALPTQ